MRTINWNAPLSEDDKAWLRDRDQHDKIADNEARFAEKDNDETGMNNPDDDYDKWKVPELAEEANKRDPKVDITGLSKKADLIAALRTWDAEHPELVE